MKRVSAGADQPPELELAKIAVHILGGFLPSRRERIRRRVVDEMEREFRENGLEPPEWIGRLRDEPWEGSERE